MMFERFDNRNLTKKDEKKFISQKVSNPGPVKKIKRKNDIANKLNII